MGPEEQSETPTFEQWIDHCFHKGRALNLDVPELPNEPSPQVLASYMRRLFQNSTGCLEVRTSDEIASGLWYIFGINSNYWWEVRSPAVPELEQAETVLSIAKFYRDFLDHRCDDSGRFPARSTSHFNRLDGAVYMLWDMDCLEGAAMIYKESHLVEPIFSVLKQALDCKSVACQISALHGLGHLQMYNHEIVNQIIEPFIREHRAALPWVEKYAGRALIGHVL